MPIRRRLAAIAVAALVAGDAAAATRTPCFSQAEIEAEQAILLQTELMVLSEACRDQVYVGFLNRNLEAVKAYQRQMIGHFRREGTGRPEAVFDSYITRLANQAAIRNGRVPGTSLCSDGQYLLAEGKALGGEGLRRYAAAKAEMHQPLYRVCRD